MSALRLATPNHPTILVDLGPGSATGHVHDGGHYPTGRIAVPEPEPVHVPSPTLGAARMRAYRERRKASLTCTDCGGALDCSEDGVTWRHVERERGLDHAPHVEGVRL